MIIIIIISTMIMTRTFVQIFSHCRGTSSWNFFDSFIERKGRNLANDFSRHWVGACNQSLKTTTFSDTNFSKKDTQTSKYFPNMACLFVLFYQNHKTGYRYLYLNREINIVHLSKKLNRQHRYPAQWHAPCTQNIQCDQQGLVDLLQFSLGTKRTFKSTHLLN